YSKSAGKERRWQGAVQREAGPCTEWFRSSSMAEQRDVREVANEAVEGDFVRESRSRRRDGGQVLEEGQHRGNQVTSAEEGVRGPSWELGGVHVKAQLAIPAAGDGRPSSDDGCRAVSLEQVPGEDGVLGNHEQSLGFETQHRLAP